MLPNPLHPAVVHFPVVFAVLMPLLMLVAIVAIRRGLPARQTWGAVLAFQVFLVLSSWVAMETGEKEEEKVEKVVAEEALEEHEEAAELFLVLTGITLLVAGAGLLSGGKGEVARYLALVGSLAVLGAGARVGHLGGELVYKHGAAQAYIQVPASETGAAGKILNEQYADKQDSNRHDSDEHDSADKHDLDDDSDHAAPGEGNGVQEAGAAQPLPGDATGSPSDSQ